MKAQETAEYKAYLCVLCGFVYDEAEGLPESNIAPGTRWEDIPDDWKCPDCDAIKADFELIEI
ncbi:MAG TPA: rubredoxin [Chromatiaceae bacterium]|jgi:rubredoxin|nr:rubredoxin [Chromatiaceae bacterium]HIA08962.1 rubredoxin [Chromatiaceae bacterium]HIN83181.1 rubredoxin [Chromatiales bacterium]HIO14767.1 rubredoxin [Chromatiales bacterium]HIO53602.1 rubredoxin [Chromatiales bacterium]